MQVEVSALSKIAITPDLLRLLVIPFFVYLAWIDLKTRRIYDNAWIPMIGIAFLALTWDIYTIALTPVQDQQEFFFALSLSIIVIPALAFVLWENEILSGDADLKAFSVLAILIPTTPSYTILGKAFPIVSPATELFALTVLTNTLVLTAIVPLGTAAINMHRGIVNRTIFYTLIIQTNKLPTVDGVVKLHSLRNTEDSNGTHTEIDLDLLRLYLRWREITIEDLQNNSQEIRGTQPEDTVIPTTTAITGDHDKPHINPVNGEKRLQSPIQTPYSKGEVSDSNTEDIDEWSAELFCQELTPTQYTVDTTPNELREFLNVISEKDCVQVQPHFPLFVFIALGIISAFTFGDLAVILGFI